MGPILSPSWAQYGPTLGIYVGTYGLIFGLMVGYTQGFSDKQTNAKTFCFTYIYIYPYTLLGLLLYFVYVFRTVRYKIMKIVLCRCLGLFCARGWVQVFMLVALVCGDLVWQLLGWYLPNMLLRVCQLSRRSADA